jgi:hypothetical protein
MAVIGIEATTDIAAMGTGQVIVVIDQVVASIRVVAVSIKVAIKVGLIIDHNFISKFATYIDHLHASVAHTASCHAAGVVDLHHPL